MDNKQKRKLPIGIQSFSEIIRGQCYYVDKTAFARQLIDEGKYYFLSRPRRFGKSLFLDTLKELFEGNEVLFKGLHLQDKWDWTRKHPVIRLGFASGVVRNRAELDELIGEMLAGQASRMGVELQNQSIAGRFGELIQKAHLQYQAQAVVLIDEYDKPILDNITDQAAAIEAREGLKNLYSVLKDADPDLCFCLLTGVSKFSKVSLFSGLNNLRDITLTAEYSGICGYTEADIDRVFAAELPGLDRVQLRHWYNGYNWGGVSVYNPFDVLLLLQERMFKPYWFESATPSFLVKLLAERGVFTPRLSDLQTDADLLGQFDVAQIGTEALLFQTGYLTIHQHQEPLPGIHTYRLGFPNYEVEVSLNKVLLPVLGLDIGQVTRTRLPLLQVLQSQDFSGLETHLRALYASLPHDWYRNNSIARYEGHYASIFYSHFAALGLNVVVEDASNNGKVDMMLAFNGHIYLFEFKVVEQVPEGKALQQLKDKRYADKYQGRGCPIHLIGVEFSREQRQIVAFEVECS